MKVTHYFLEATLKQKPTHFNEDPQARAQSFQLRPSYIKKSRQNVIDRDVAYV
jgi:hypothetical protein